jgi:SAM-dependent methyltransferase
MSTETVTAWGMMQPHDTARFGDVINDPAERKRWCTAILIGGLPYIWQELAPVPRRMFLNRLELQAGDRVLLIGEGLEGIGIADEIGERIGPDGEIVTVDFMERVRDVAGAGGWAQWGWDDYTKHYADGHFDAIAIFQGVAHADDWRTAGAELLRVLKPGRMIVLGEVVFGPPLNDVIELDVHVTYVFTKIAEAMFAPGFGIKDMPYWSPERIEEAFEGQVEEGETFVWRGVELFWGRKPAGLSA